MDYTGLLKWAQTVQYYDQHGFSHTRAGALERASKWVCRFTITALLILIFRTTPAFEIVFGLIALEIAIESALISVRKDVEKNMRWEIGWVRRHIKYHLYLIFILGIYLIFVLKNT